MLRAIASCTASFIDATCASSAFASAALFCSVNWSATCASSSSRILRLLSAAARVVSRTRKREDTSRSFASPDISSNNACVCFNAAPSASTCSWRAAKWTSLSAVKAPTASCCAAIDSSIFASFSSTPSLKLSNVSAFDSADWTCDILSVMRTLRLSMAAGMFWPISSFAAPSKAFNLSDWVMRSAAIT